MFKFRRALQTRLSVFAIFAGALLIVVPLAGCGNSDEGEGGAELTHAQVVKQGDAICARTSTTATKELTARLKKLPQGLTPKIEEELILTVSVPAIGAMAADLSKINAPPEDKQELEAISSAFTSALAKVKADPSVTAKDPYAKAAGLADTFGFLECSKF